MEIESIKGETRWSKFKLDGIPLDTTINDLTSFLLTNYTELTLSQTPR